MNQTDPPKKQPEILADGKHVRLVRVGPWEFAQRKKVSGIVAVVAITDDRKILLVEQDRPPVGSRVIELPAGLAGDVEGHETEELADAARRELLEETGYEAREMTYLTRGAASAGITDEVITLFRATGLRKTGPGAGDGSEQITLHEVPLEKVEAWLADRQEEGKLLDLKLFSGLYFARSR